jgi:hypothetical protein
MVFLTKWTHGKRAVPKAGGASSSTRRGANVRNTNISFRMGAFIIRGSDWERRHLAGMAG